MSANDPWYEAATDDTDIAQRVFGYLDSLESDQSLIRALNALNARQYAAKDVMGIGGNRGIGSFSINGSSYRVTENIVASVIDTWVALIAATRPLPMFITEGAEWSKQQAAKQYTKFVRGQYKELGVYNTWVKSARDGGVFGTGAVKVAADRWSKRPFVDRVLCDNIVVDEQEAREADPRQMHQRRWVDLGVLKAHYPDKAEELDKGDKARQVGVRMGRGHTNMVEVVESWHLPSEPKAEDGRYIVSTRDVVLEDERYKKDYFPFVFYRFTEPLTGFYGAGIAEPLTNLQQDLIDLNSFIKAAHRRIIRPDVYVDFDQRMPDKFFETGMGRLFRTRGGKAPTFYTPQALNAETYNERRYIVERAFALMGVSEMSAQAKKQPGITSGVAINAISDLQSGRFGIQSEMFEDVHCQTAQRMTWVMKDLDGSANVTVAFKAKHFVETIKWSDVDPKEDVYHVDIEASSLMSKTPAGRLQQSMDFFQMGIFDKRQFLQAVDMPDTQRLMDVEAVSYQYAEYAIEKCLSGEFVMPEPFEDLTLCIKLTQLAYLKARLDGAPEDILEILQRRIDMAQQMIQQATPPPAPAAPMLPPGGPLPPDAGMGMPGGPPQGVVPGMGLPGPGMPLPA